jgi:hypothetical protein
MSPEALGTGQHVAHEVDPAALPRSAEHHRLDRTLEAGVLIGDHQLHPAQASSS